jgi:hypothetical protein
MFLNHANGTISRCDCKNSRALDGRGRFVRKTKHIPSLLLKKYVNSFPGIREALVFYCQAFRYKLKSLPGHL